MTNNVTRDVTGDVTEQVLDLSIEGCVATIQLNRPERFNAFDTALRHALLEAVETVENDDKVRIVIIKGEGRGFCAGADLRDGLHDPVSDHLENEYKPFLTRIHQGKKLYIAQVHGSAAGIGAALAMVCDFMVMAEDATIYMAFAAIGLIPDGGNTWLLLHRLGYRRALEAVVEGRHLDADTCHQVGIANKVVAANDLDETVRDWADSLSKQAPLAVTAAKRLLRSVGRASYAESISMEAREQNHLTRSKDFKRGVDAFLSKTKPVFKGD